MTSGASMASSGRCAGGGSPGTSGGSISSGRGLLSTLGDRVKTMSVLPVAGASSRSGSTEATVSPIRNWSPGPSIARDTRTPPTSTPLAEFVSTISTPSTMPIWAWFFDTRGSVRRMSLAALRPSVDVP